MKTNMKEILDMVENLQNLVKRSGFEQVPENKPCRNPNHRPPMHLYIPPGQQYRHVCPSCGNESILRSPNITY